MWTVWRLENDLVVRRLHEDPGIIRDGGSGAPLGSLDCVWDPEVLSPGHGTETVALRRYRGDHIGALMHLDSEVAWEPRGSLEVWIRRLLFGTRRFFEVVMTLMRPRLHRGCNSFWNPEADPKSFGEPWISSRSGARIKTRRSLGTQNVLFFAGTLLRHPRQDYYRKSLTDLESACHTPEPSWTYGRSTGQKSNKNMTDRPSNTQALRDGLGMIRSESQNFLHDLDQFIH
ncbi:hypothetical protein F2Q68_00017414 [Brassica cretica]|uniref:Uncharacterized protein n=1 Tax=Brassica cretica TaxID=69181 RepID=A0A8S9HL07_BRACR|nr:hypothetical protein F2Q68_00017414 [Brassica cretica]